MLQLLAQGNCLADLRPQLLIFVGDERRRIITPPGYLALDEMSLDEILSGLVSAQEEENAIIPSFFSIVPSPPLPEGPSFYVMHGGGESARQT